MHCLEVMAKLNDEIASREMMQKDINTLTAKLRDAEDKISELTGLIKRIGEAHEWVDGWADGYRLY